ncbi:MAG: hypothetical protein HKN20_15140 [Gemmatimonadetes bacterium]|nr:hypothetical protein [Gemmatimonadota bacterium]
MKKMAMVLSVLALVAFAGNADAQWYAKGDMYCAPGCFNFDAGNEMFDDGTNGDVTSGDGIFSRLVTTDVGAAGKYSWKAAVADWSISYPGSNQFVHINAAAEQVLFTLDTNVYADGFIPTTNIAWSDHYAPVGAAYEVIGAAPETGGWADGIVAAEAGGVHSVTITIGTAGNYDFLWRVDNDWDAQTIRQDGGASGGANLNYTTTVDNQDVLFEFDANTGRTRTTVLTPTATDETSWTGMKELFR